MTQFRKGQHVEVYRSSKDENWEPYMMSYIGSHGIVTDPNTVINHSDSMIEISLDGHGTHRLPQDCLRIIESRN